MRCVLLCVLSILLAAPVAAQTLDQDLATFVETPAVTGYEVALAKEISARLEKFKPQTDNMSNVWVTLGSGAPHRLIVAPMDEPGYVVSAITDDGYLRVQRLPQQSPHPQFDQLHAAQAVVIQTRRGKAVYGVVAGLSTHLQGGRRDAPRVNHPDEIYIDVGASSAAETHRAGVDVLDPVALDRKVYLMGGGMLTATSIGDRFGAAALVELLRRLDPAKIQGTLTLAFVAQQWATSRGFDRLTQHIKAEEVIYVGRLRRAAQGGGAAASTEETQQPAQRRAPKLLPGSGVLIGLQDPDAAPTDLPAALWRMAQENKIPVAVDFSAALPRVTYTRGPELPARFAHLSVATAWPSTPAEFIDFMDLFQLGQLLDAYAHGGAISGPKNPDTDERPILKPRKERPTTAPAVTEILSDLVEVYGVSGFEGPVRAEVERLLPPWAKPETDEAGNLILRFGSTGAGKKLRIVFVAHTDEIGYVVRSVAEDGRLVVQSRGGGIIEFFAGHPMLVHAAAGVRPGVMELPAGWDQPNFEWPRGQAAAGALRVDVGARAPAEVEKLGIRVGDSITVPKKYRKLYGTRANGRSFDDRVGCTALVAAAWMLGPSVAGREIIFILATEEEVGLRGANAAAQKMAADGRAPDYVFAVDTFVSADSPLESKRFANAPIGKGFVIRAVDNSNIVRRELVDKLIALARAQQIPVQYGITGGGNDGATFLRHGTLDIPISWPLRYSHSPGEVIDTRDVDALARIVAAIARNW
jgi:putative aminopeptidase FrvX